MRTIIPWGGFFARLGLGLVVAAFAHAACAASPNKLTFSLRHETLPSAIMGSARAIFASGIIEPSATELLEGFIASNNVPDGSEVIFDSPGGNLIEALKLRRSLRQHSFNTDVGRPGPRTYELAPNVCASACTFAFMGGKFRFISGGSVFGVHRFHSLVPDPEASDTAQVVSAMLAQYLHDMDVEQAFLTAMSEAGPSDVNILPPARLLALNVINNGTGPTTWAIESARIAVCISVVSGRRPLESANLS